MSRVWSPASTASCSSHSAWPTVTASSGVPVAGPGVQRTRSNLSVAPEANSWDAIWPCEPRMLTENWARSRTARSVPLRLLTLASSSGGSTETLHTAEHVRPRGSSSLSSVVTMETPLASEAITVRNSWMSTDEAIVGMAVCITAHPPLRP